MADDLPFRDVISSIEGLRDLYRTPPQEIIDKKFDELPAWARVFIEASPFVFLATADAAGRPTVSPKGGEPGFVTVLDPRRLAIPDYPGNNLLDGLTNLVENPTIGIIFLIPGRSETIRVDGEAWTTTDPEVLEACRTERRIPKTAIGVRIREAFFHCPSSFRRASLWKPESWRDDAAGPFEAFIRSSLPSDHWPDWALEDDEEDEDDLDPD